MKMKNVKKIDMNKKLYEQIKALLADKLDEKEQKIKACLKIKKVHVKRTEKKGAVNNAESGSNKTYC